MSAKNKINLLPQEEFEGTTFGRILKWLMSSFRMLVVATEVVVIAAFLSRFWLDAKNTDLDDEIRQKQAVIVADAAFEKEFKNTQKRLRIYSALSKNEKTQETINIISSIMPADITLKSIGIQDGSVQLSGSATSEPSIFQFILNLTANENFKDVTLTGVSGNVESINSLDFNLTFNLKG